MVIGIVALIALSGLGVRIGALGVIHREEERRRRRAGEWL